MNQIPTSRGRTLQDNIIPAGSYWFTDGQRVLPKEVWQQLARMLGVDDRRLSDKASRVAVLRNPGLYTHEWCIADHARFIFVPTERWRFGSTSFRGTLVATGNARDPKGMILLTLPCGIELHSSNAWKLELPCPAAISIGRYQSINIGPYTID